MQRNIETVSLGGAKRFCKIIQRMKEEGENVNNVSRDS